MSSLDEAERMLPSYSTLRAPTRTPVTNWLPDETFYSVCSRQHCILGNNTPSATLSWLFGSPAAATSHDLPYNLGALNNAAKAAWGDTHSIIYTHTILPFFLPFRTDEHALQAEQAMEGPRLGSLKYRLGLLTGRFGAEHPLKACTSCMATDLVEHGCAYWHLSHQYPGVVVCPLHREMLRNSCFNRQWSGRFQWVLPDEDTLAPAQSISPSEKAMQALERIAAAILDLAACAGDRRFHPNILTVVYKNACSDGEHNGGRGNSFAHHCSLVQPYPPFTSLPASPEKAHAFLAQLIRNQRGYSHPLKHLAAITWRYGSLADFVEMYDRTLSLHSTARSPDYKYAVRTIGVPPASTPACVAATHRRPKVLKPVIRAEMLKCLQRGEAKQHICSTFGVTVSTVNKLLRSEPSIQQSWHDEFVKAQIGRYRAIWEAATGEFSDSSPKAARIKNPRAYAWLYRNDHKWLMGHNRDLSSGRHGNHCSVDWEARDASLLALLQRATNDLQGYNARLKICRKAIFLACPSLAKALQKKDRYPRTRAFLKTLIWASRGSDCIDSNR